MMDSTVLKGFELLEFHERFVLGFQRIHEGLSSLVIDEGNEIPRSSDRALAHRSAYIETHIGLHVDIEPFDHPLGELPDPIDVLFRFWAMAMVFPAWSLITQPDLSNATLLPCTTALFTDIRLPRRSGGCRLASFLDNR